MQMVNMRRRHLVVILLGGAMCLPPSLLTTWPVYSLEAVWVRPRGDSLPSLEGEDDMAAGVCVADVVDGREERVPGDPLLAGWGVAVRKRERGYG